MSQSIKTSLDKIRLLESQQLSEAPAMAAPAAKVAGKGVGRFIPGVGAAIGAYDAYNRAKQGDWTGAGLSALGGAASLVPGVGTAASIGIAGAQALRDKQRTGSYLPGDDEIAAGVAKDKQAQPAQATAAPTAKVPPGGDPKVFALQQQLIAKGAKISADGKMGPATQAAMKQFPGVQMASKINNPKGKIMSESDKIAALRARLEQIDNQQVNEGPLDALAKFGKGVATAGKNFARGASGQAPRTATGAYTKAGGATKAGQAAGAVGQAVKNNPVKTAAAGMAAAGAAGYMAGKPGAPAPTAKPPVGGKPAAAAAAAPAQTANAGPDPKDVEALNAMADELQNSQDPVDIELMKQYNGIINAINNRAKDDKRTQGEIAASAALGDMQ
jgi:peptidoglycan hydrolase-like protein with peptidoglycan-binding domain